jgi:branched-chain amino acid transport system substrate-binding protein
VQASWLVVGACGVALAASAAALTTGDTPPASAQGAPSSTTLTIYSSLPRRGPSAGQTKAIERGAALALAERGGKVRQYSIVYKRLDDSLASTGAADEGRGQANARTAADDPTTIGFIGAYNSGISKVEIPILNRAGIAQVSPSNTYIGLTRDGPGTEPGEPDKYYPTGKRTYARVQPNDIVQAAALATAARDQKCKSVELFDSRTTYSEGVAKRVQETAARIGLEVRASRSFDPRARNYRSLAKRVKSPCVISSGEIESNGLQLLKDVGARRPRTRLFASDGMCLNDTAAHLPRKLTARFRCTIAVLAPSAYGPKGRQFFSSYSSRHNDRNPDPYAIYGYESMALLLDAIQTAGAPPPSGGPYQDPNAQGTATRDSVVAALFATKDRDSVLGTYGITASGDTTLTDYGLYRISSKTLRFDRVIRTQGAAR